MVIGGARGSTTDAATLTITAGGTSQQVFAANNNRVFLRVENLSAGDLWYKFGVAAGAAAPSWKLAPGERLTIEPPGFIDTRPLNIIGAATGQAFSAEEA